MTRSQQKKLDRLEQIILFLIGILVGSSVAHGEWFKYQPAGAVDGKGILEDVTSRTHDPQLNKFRSNKATWTHEATHCVNFDIRKLRSSDERAFYVGGGHAIVLKEPNISFDQFDRHVTAYRNDTYRHYFAQARSNNDRLGFLDEWTAYCNDVQCTNELKLSEDGGRDRATWFATWATALVATVREHDPRYAQLKELIEFVEWQKRRVATLTEKQHEAGGDFMADLPPSWRERNRASSCVHMSTAHIMRYKELFADANQWLSTHRGGDSPSPHKRELEATGLKYAMTRDADDGFLEWCIANRLMVGVTTKADHCLNLVGRVTDAGRRYAVLLDNNRPNTYEYEDWNSWYRKYKQSGWAFTITSGTVPPPTPL